MTKREIAIKYVDDFCDGNIEGIAKHLATDLVFSGSCHAFISAEEYLASLRSDPPEKCGYTILSITENCDSVAIFYEYEKTNSTIQIAQLFTISGQKITKILLIFDSAKIA